MAGITAQIAEARLIAYLDAEAAVLRNQEYQMADGRRLRRADLREIRAGIDYWQKKVDALQATPVARGRVRRGVVL